MKRLTVVSAAVGVMAGVRRRSVAPQAGIALTVRTGGVTRRPAELWWAVAGANGAVTGQKPASNYKRRRLSHYRGILLLSIFVCITDKRTHSGSSQTAEGHCFDPGPPDGHS